MLHGVIYEYLFHDSPTHAKVTHIFVYRREYYLKVVLVFKKSWSLSFDFDSNFVSAYEFIIFCILLCFDRSLMFL